MTLLIFLVTASSSAWASLYSEVVVFGDSLSDTGNLYDRTFGLLPDSPPYFNGRFSNGPLWVERLADQLTLTPPAPLADGGTNNAVGGAETGSGTTSLIVPNIGRQISNYLSSHTLNSSQLVVVWGGANDFINDSGTNPAVPVGNIANHISALHTGGATNFLIPNLPPLGQTPRFVGTANESNYDNLSSQFNSLLTTQLASLEITLGVNIYEFDVSHELQSLLDNPELWGITNVTEPALNPSTNVPEANSEEYLYWDDLHPTTGPHGLLGDRAAILLVPTYAQGDTDADGDIDTSDLTTILQNFTGVGAIGSLFPDGDTDGDGDVDTADLTTGFQSFTGAQNLSLSTEAAPSEAASVPEPASLLMALIGAGGVLVVRHRSKPAGSGSSA